jgi:hypothetical protein
MAQKSSNRAESIMRQTHSEERASTRVPLHLSGTVRIAAAELAEHLALIRDISFHGVFLYSNFKPPLGSSIQLSLSLPLAGRTVSITCQGKVVRTEESTSSACGIAVRLDHCNFVPATTAA